jgi:cellulose synthase operon protein C
VYNNKFLIAGAAFCASATVALACAIDLPNQLLNNREETLKAPLSNSFAYEIRRLVGPVGNGAAAESQQRSAAEAKGLSNDEAKLLFQIEQNDDEKAILAVAGDLPIAVRLYAAGAADFHHGEMDLAERRFQAVLDLPSDERMLRATFAAYSLGRIATAAGDDAKAIQAFQLTRDLARAGMSDPGGLAVASYGEEARIHFRRAKKLLVDGVLPDAGVADYVREISSAISLYAEQAARQSESGTSSLRIVAQHILGDRSTILAAAEVPNAQRLMVAFVLARFWNDIPDPDDQVGPKLAAGVGSPFHATEVSANELITILAEASRRHGEGWLADGDRLAALAYREGKYDITRRLVDKASGPLASWLKAKLALQTGDVAAATTFYSEAARAFPANDDENPLDQNNRSLLAGETGVLALARGEYVTALEFLYGAREYWPDVAYVADRVLTIDELKAFVDSKAPESENNDASQSNAARLRNLLARRLMRQGRFQDGFQYFQDARVRQQAMDYAHALEEAKNRWLPIARAESWYKAAALVRYAGMEMMGSEGDPDYAYWGGGFEGGIGPEGEELNGPFVTAGEADRFATSKIEPDKRYHYRYIAADYAARGADLLPTRSQAFAAVLCHATDWMLSTHEDVAARRLYHRYVEQGALVPWALHFGRRCPEPDFDGAPASLRKQIFNELHHLISVERWAILAGMIAVAALFGGAWLRFRRRT